MASGNKVCALSNAPSFESQRSPLSPTKRVEPLPSDSFVEADDGSLRSSAHRAPTGSGLPASETTVSGALASGRCWAGEQATPTTIAIVALAAAERSRVERGIMAPSLANCTLQ